MSQYSADHRDLDSEGLADQVAALMSGQRDFIANAANLAALLYHAIEDVNWVGFYLLKDGELVVGPFQGRPACVTIPMGKGVCGTAAATRKVQRVADVHAFDGHIACDATSRSELVLPLLRDKQLLGVLDLDSPLPDRFSERDEVLLREIAEIFVQSVD